MVRKEPSTLYSPAGLVKTYGDGDDRLSERTLERMRTNGTGPPFVRFGRRIFYREVDVEKWLDRQTRTHTNQKATDRRAVRAARDRADSMAP